MKRLVIISCLLVSAGLQAGSRTSDRLILYASPDPEWVALLAREFEKEQGVKVDWMRESSGVVLQRLKAERNNPKGSVWFGGTFDAHAEAARQGLLEAYTPTNVGELAPLFQNPLGNHLSTGAYGAILGFAVNESLLKKLAKPVPQSWQDLLDPTYRGLIVMANPNISGTAYTILATLMKLKGQEAGLQYLQQLDKNIAHYTQSGATTTTLVGQGEAAIAIVFLQDAIKDRLKGYPIREVVPTDGTGYEIGGLSLIKGGPHPELGRKFIDWALTPRIQQLAVKGGAYNIPSNTNTPLDKNIVTFSNVKLVDLPINWLVENRGNFLKLWQEKVFRKS